jgi:hypothetical protein
MSVELGLVGSELSKHFPFTSHQEPEAATKKRIDTSHQIK